MAACGSLEHIFEKPLPENPTLLESLTSWKKSMKPIDDSSFTEIFGELHFKENHASESFSSSPLPQSSPSSSLSSNSSFFPDANKKSDNEKLNREKNESINSNNHEKAKSPTSSYYPTSTRKKQYRHSDSFSSVNSDSLSLCTEGLGFESFDDVEDLLRNDICNEFQHQEERKSFTRNAQTESHWSEYSKRSRTNRGSFPPPISSIGRSGKPWVCFKSYRENGRFILKEMRIPTQEFMHSCRENGRLKLQFIHSDEEILESDEDEEEDEDNIEEINEVPGENDDAKSKGNANEGGRDNGEENVEINNSEA
ncbi:protein FAF-like, chloroplastic [Olea europaea var. sylvestris]|uniref:protein FAF-like, chloroplastic n=1 Tax=Olea europaea var. sylvestris TaxID=158386 RepID=UPI000C1D657F|nr:protein FAF-like, chloroplastic [Olea europaea var. sylvestris]